MLENLFGRTIVGFDIRKNSALSNLFMTSFDDSVRYEEINEKYQDQQSGLNLFYIDPSDIPSLNMPVDARIIAFDLPTERVEQLSKGIVSNPKPCPFLNIDCGWKFMGFDVVDAITQTSVFHGFDLTKSDISKILEEHAIVFNKNGLIDDGKKAVNIALFFDKKIPIHAPFSHCGLWLKDN